MFPPNAQVQMEYHQSQDNVFASHNILSQVVNEFSYCLVTFEICLFMVPMWLLLFQATSMPKRLLVP